MTQPTGLPPEGWYPNPDNAEQQRWWDGSAWTEHVAVGAPIVPGYEPRPAAAPPEAAPVGYPAAPANPYAAPYQGHHAQAGATAPLPYAGQPGYGQPGYGQPGYGQPGYGQPAYGGHPGYATYPAYAPGGQRGLLPDGARVVGWWWRVLARLIDGLLVSVVSSIVAASQIRVIDDVNQRFSSDLRAAVDANAAIPSLHDYFWQGDYLRALVWIGVSYAVVAFVYEVVMLKATSGTVGKLVCGLRVRDWERRGRLGWRAVLLRGAAYQLAGGLPGVGGPYTILDRLWPLWDGRKQALHDKVARTAVVKRSDA